MEEKFSLINKICNPDKAKKATKKGEKDFLLETIDSFLALNLPEIIAKESESKSIDAEFVKKLLSHSIPSFLNFIMENKQKTEESSAENQKFEDLQVENSTTPELVIGTAQS